MVCAVGYARAGLGSVLEGYTRWSAGQFDGIFKIAKRMAEAEEEEIENRQQGIETQVAEPDDDE